MQGDYVFVYDDDVVLTDDTFFARAKALAEEFHPGVIIVKCAVINLTFPDKWPAEKGHIDTANFIVSKEVWLKHRRDWRVVPKEEGGEGGDFAFIDAVLKDDPIVGQLDIIASKHIRVSKGSPEEHDFVLPADTLAREAKETVAKIIKRDRIGNSIAIGDEIRIVVSSGGKYIYSEGDVFDVNEENIDHIESLIRGGLAEKI